MAQHNDPTVCHSACCQTCGDVVADADTLNHNGDCHDCEEAYVIEDEENEDD